MKLEFAPFTSWNTLLLAGLITSAEAATVTVSLPSSVPSYNIVQDNFSGISLEFNVLDYLIGPNPSQIPIAMKNYLTNLRSRISNDFRLRVGGNSLDGSFYDPAASQMLTFNLNSTADGIKNIPVTFGPQVVTTLDKLGSDVGGIYHLLGLSLLHLDNNTNVVAFASAAEAVLGSSLDAFLDGNEPDLYEENAKRHVNYTVADYSTDLNQSADDLKAGNVTTLLGSPSICCSHPNWGLADVLGQTLKSPVASQLKYTTLQHYPQQSCNAFGTNRWNISYFTNHSNVQALMSFQGDGVEMARAAGKQVIMDETNSASCGGEPGRSDTFAAALWTLDYNLGLASANYSAVYMHTREPGITYNLFNYPAPSTEALIPASALNSGWETGPNYYAMVLLAEAFSNLGSKANGSVVVDLDFIDPLAGAGYALYDADNLNPSHPRALVLMNFQNGTQAEAQANVTLSTFVLPSGLVSNSSATSSVRLLVAPTLNERSSSAVSYAGQTVDDSGALTGTRVTSSVRCYSGCQIVVPGPGAALVLLNNGEEQVATSNHKKGAASLILAWPSMLAWSSLIVGGLVSSFT